MHGNFPWRRLHVQAMVWMQVRVKDSKQFWAQAAADTVAVVRPLPQFAASGADAPAAQKRLEGCTASAQVPPCSPPPPCTYS